MHDRPNNNAMATHRARPRRKGAHAWRHGGTLQATYTWTCTPCTRGHVLTLLTLRDYASSLFSEGLIGLKSGMHIAPSTSSSRGSSNLHQDHHRAHDRAGLALCPPPPPPRPLAAPLNAPRYPSSAAPPLRSPNPRPLAHTSHSCMHWRAASRRGLAHQRSSRR